MIIKNIRLIEFGAYKDRSFNFDNGLNLIYGKNEVGKTTLRSSIDAVLYGFLDGKTLRKSYVDGFETYTGGSSNVSMKLCYDNRYYLVERNLSMETCRVFDEGNNDITEKFSLTNKILTPGNDFLNVDSETFRKFFYIDTTNKDVGDLGFLILKDEMDEDIVSKAIRNLKKENEELGSDRSWQKKRPRIKNEIANLEDEIRAGEEVLIQSSKKKIKTDEINNELRKHDTRLLKLYRRETKLEDLKNEIYHDSLNMSSKKKSNKIIFPILAVLFILAAFVTKYAFNLDKYFWYLNIISAIFIVVFILSNIYNSDSNEKKEYEINDVLGEISIVNSKIKEINDSKMELQKELSFLEGQLDNIMKVSENTLYLKDRLSVLKRQSENMDRRYLVNELTIDALDFLKIEKKKAPKTMIINRAEDIYFNITGKNDLIISDKMELFLDRERRMGEKNFSSGTMEIAIFSLKLAFNEFLTDEDFIIFDDAFLFVDDERLEKIAEILYNISSKKQIMYFTSNKRLLDIINRKYYNINEVIIWFMRFPIHILTAGKTNLWMFFQTVGLIINKRFNWIGSV